MKITITASLCSFVLVPFLLTTVKVQAAIYKCVKENSDVYYNDKPCSVDDAESQIKAVKDPEGGYIPPKFVADKEAERSNGVVVGSSSNRSINKNAKDVSKDSTNENNNGSSSNNVSTNSESLLNSEKSSSNDINVSEASSKSNTSQGSTENNNNDSKYPVKNVIPHEGYYKDKG